MSEWIDRKYAGLLSARLERYSVKSQQPYLANFRCPICGDSQKNKWKTRGYLFEKKGGLFYKCHNCSFSSSLGNLVKELDDTLYKQYVLERYKEGGHHRQSHANVSSIMDFSAPVFKKKSILDELLDPVVGTPAEQYLIERLVPKEKWDGLYYIDNMQKMENLSEKYKDRIVGEEARLVLPFYDRDGLLVGVTCRALGSERLRYVTVKINDDNPFIFNLDKVDFNKTIYVTEGPIDSLFLDNAVAVGSSDLKVIKRYLPKEKVVLVFDNQPRNKQLVDIMSTAAKGGLKMVVWPEHIKQKDINEMIVSGVDNIQEVIDNNAFEDLELMLQLNLWKKI